MVKVKRGKEMAWKKYSKMALSSSPIIQRSFRHNEPEKESEFSDGCIECDSVTAMSETHVLNENKKVDQESASQPRPASLEIKDWLIVNSVSRLCRGKELFIFGFVVTLTLLCIQLTLLRKSIPEVGTKQMEDFNNKLRTENENFKREFLAEIHDLGTEQMADIVSRLRAENENFKSGVLAKIRDIDEGLKNAFESHLNAFHNKLLKELKRRDQTLHLDEVPISGEGDGKESLVDDKGEETTNEGKEKGGWLETIKNVILWLSLVPTLHFFSVFFFVVFSVLREERRKRNEERRLF
ncbi:uncharacterized protein [Parasteatoda tepidariorum]|uniref:uncharacterized protein isoform X1 n=2 Tax=Parasteatoda tepidariorum TaxID=114398 RepID=UPI001C723791|nr:uncharacterized protein LOC107443900 isoform X2 [Parasteatoda tepidariorum]